VRTWSLWCGYIGGWGGCAFVALVIFMMAAIYHGAGAGELLVRWV